MNGILDNHTCFFFLFLFICCCINIPKFHNVCRVTSLDLLWGRTCWKESVISGWPESHIIMKQRKMIHRNTTRVLATCPALHVPILFPSGSLSLVTSRSNWYWSLICDWWRQPMSGCQHNHLERKKVCCHTDP